MIVNHPDGAETRQINHCVSYSVLFTLDSTTKTQVGLVHSLQPTALQIFAVLSLSLSAICSSAIEKYKLQSWRWDMCEHEESRIWICFCVDNLCILVYERILCHLPCAICQCSQYVPCMWNTVSYYIHLSIDLVLLQNIALNHYAAVESCSYCMTGYNARALPGTSQLLDLRKEAQMNAWSTRHATRGTVTLDQLEVSQYPVMARISPESTVF